MDNTLGKDAEQRGQGLCQRCGMCCDGTLFGGIPIKKGESLEEFQAAGYSTFWQEEKEIHALVQPCSQYRDCKCQAYADRPRACRYFECQLYARVVGGEMELEPAVEIVERARDQQALLKKLIAEHLPDLSELSLREALKRIDEMLEATGDELVEFQKRHGRLLVRALAYRQFRRKHFRRYRPPEPRGEN